MDITPDMIARLASKIYNSAPGTNGSSANHAATSASQQLSPSAPASVDRFDLPAASRFANGAAGVPAAPAIPVVDLPSKPAGTSLPSSLPGDIGAGVKSFVEQVRNAGIGTLGAGFFRIPSSPASHFVGASHGSAPQARPLDVDAVRRDFPILRQTVHGRPLAWFDNAATTQKPQCVIDAISNFYSRDNSNIHRGAHTLAARATDAYEGARAKTQRFLGASSSNEIIFARGTTEAINLVAQTYGRKFLQPGDEIVLTTLEHHANIVPWQLIARERQAVIRVAPVNDRGEIILEQYQSLLGSRTQLVALAHASNSLGTVLPVAEMTQMAKRHGARVLIDGAQSVSHMPVNVQQLGCDFFVFSGHKIFGPTGIGALYVTRELQDIMPPWQGGGNMIKTVTFEETTYADPPAKFEAGTPNIADAVGLGAALDYVQQFGLAAIGAYERQLAEYATEQLSRVNGVRLIGTAREKVGVLSLVVAGRDPVEIGKMLDAEGIAVRAGHHCAEPSLRRFGLEATVRPSLAFYNTRGEVDRLVTALRRISDGRTTAA